MVRAQIGDDRWVIELLLGIDLTVLLSNVGLSGHFAIDRVDIEAKNARTALSEFGTVRAEASLAAICQVDAGVGAPEVTAMVAASRNPLDGALVLDISKQAGIEALAARVVALLSMHRLVVDHVHVLLEGVVHECETVASTGIISRHLGAAPLEPFDLVPSHAVHTARAIAVSSASTKEPDACIDNVRIFGVFDRKIIGVLVKHLVAVVIVKVG